MADYYKLVFELEESPGREMFVLCTTKERVDEKIKQLREDFTLKFFKIVEIK